MLCAPNPNVDVVKVATPPLMVEAPSVIVPSLKVTVPVGVPVVDELTVAVNVTACPTLEGFAEDIRTVLVPAGWTISVTVTVCVWKLESPE